MLSTNNNYSKKKKMLGKTLVVLFGLSALAICINGHGMMIDPPNRGSAWRYDPAKFPPYYQDNGLYCGDSPTMMNPINRKI